MATTPRRYVDRLAAGLQHVWTDRGRGGDFLLPLAWLYGAAVALRRASFRRGWRTVYRLPARVVVVGNLIVGGAGKTPAVIAVVDILRAAGRKPGIVSRGYGRSGDDVVEVEATTDPRRAGDEPVVLRRRTGVAVFVAADRVSAAHALLQAHPEVDVIVADDGLQHLALGRDVEVVVFDERGMGNGRLLPAGPLREAAMPSGQTPGVDATVAPARLILYNAAAPTTPLPGHASQRVLAGVATLDDWRAGVAPSLAALHALRGRPVVAVAGVARPARFFAMLRDAGLDIVEHPLPDHHAFDTLPWSSTAGDVVLTEKDAVKIDPGRRIGTRVWVATLDFVPDPAFAAALLEALGSRDESLPAPAPPAHGNPPA